MKPKSEAAGGRSDGPWVDGNADDWPPDVTVIDGSLSQGGATPADGPAADGGGQRDAQSPPRPPFDWMGIIGTGQSLAVGNLGLPINMIPPAYHNLKLSLGRTTVAPPFDPNDPSLSMVALSEPIRPVVPLADYPSAYPANIFGETPHTFMANQISALFSTSDGGEYQTVHSVVGESGQGIRAISKGAPDTGRTGRAYAATLFEVSAIKRLATAAGKTYGVGAIVFTHGEQDATSATYASAVHQLWADYNTDLRGITGQATTIPMLLTQQHSAPFGAGSAAQSTLDQWRLGVTYPGDIVCVGPKYQYQYTTDGRHLVTHEYDRLGEKYGQVYYEKIVLGRDWQPLQPKSATRNGTTIAIDFNVPVGPLNWDENIVPPHQAALIEWAKGRGFEITNAAGRVSIDSVAIMGSSVILTMAPGSQPSGLQVGYAMAQDEAGAMAGPTRGRRGQLRDADPFIGVDGETIACMVTSGAAQIQSMVAGAFHARGERDLAGGAGLAGETIVLTKDSDSTMTLSKPWSGPSGTADISFHTDQRNYCVSFEMAVP